MCKQLGLAEGYTLAEFQMFNIAQALLLPQASDRFDDATQTTAAKFIDLGDRAAADASVRAVVRKMFGEWDTHKRAGGAEPTTQRGPAFAAL